MQLARRKRTFGFGELSTSGKIVVYVLLFLGLLLFAFPVLWMLATSVKTLGGVHKQTLFPETFEWRNYVEIFDVAPMGMYLWNTSWYTLICVIGAAFSSSLVAFGFARLRARGSLILFGIVLSTMMIPSQVTMIPQYLLFTKLGWADSYLPLIIPSFGGSAFLIFLLRQFYMGIPRELDEAVKIDGGGYFTMYFRIILPLSIPALATAGIMEFMYRWNDLMGPLIYLSTQTKYPLSLGLANFQAAYAATPWNLLMAASLVAVLPPLLLFFFCQKYFIQGIVISGTKG
ncbi:carbohydrate ABC transporter permease [Lederbergia citrea]|uniref:Carbohydrate ABC transporter permease n=1 Tax=Lederbergia citrea TaxID=2833581 RepID=A0A942UQK1_9BACI|nr:carbohydrate ABC transporter permease [Lederbergia citrea]MBS4178453.1 carbohydrate ABC transporter permease [Lederbergia citrea]MBS4205125.1 carbohydrate ABC transporter permease [Lederbergia citrea]MBS4223013.1 carbohydrate ABC transporter permease [Lederbergia citrea]